MFYLYYSTNWFVRRVDTEVHHGWLYVDRLGDSRAYHVRMDIDRLEDMPVEQVPDLQPSLPSVNAPFTRARKFYSTNKSNSKAAPQASHYSGPCFRDSS